MREKLRYMLLQVRNADDPMRDQEVATFAANLGCDVDRIQVVDLIADPPGADADFADTDVILLGGSGDYSVVTGGPWLAAALSTMRRIVELGKPTFASCWGFQALARALGGAVIHDPNTAELGTVALETTIEADDDPVFAPLGEKFEAQIGHEDRVSMLPDNVTALAYGEVTEHQAYRVNGLPIYATQFHPELTLDGLLERVAAYPKYCEEIAGVSFDEFKKTCRATPAAEQILPRFIDEVVIPLM